ncbi:MAG TPA: putative porin, partial [Candidatus Eremiobacteraceae bacterium]|nr:putative porin [Candidatus Eremiobacteraceae bacterium]
PLLLTGGKMAYPFYRTELVWDNDLNPEGVAQTLQWDFKSAPFIRHFAVVGFQLPFTEVAGTKTNKSIVESVVYGGQLQAIWQLKPWLKLSTYGSFYNYHNADPIALALARASTSNPQTPLNGLLVLGGASVQNSITTLTANNVVTHTEIDPNTGFPVPVVTPTGVKTITSAQFASKFALVDVIAKLDITTPYKRLPITLLGDYVQNTRACANLGNILKVAPPPTATTTFTLVNSVSGTDVTLVTPTVCDPRERRGYWLEGRFGRLAEHGDFQFAYTRMLIEREAVMGAFNFSDMRQNSNVTQHRVELFYQAHRNVQLEFTGLFGRPLNWNKPGGTPPEHLLKRLQFDVIYKF